MVSKTEFWDNINDIKFIRTLNLEEYVFEDKNEFIEFIDKIASLLGNSGIEVQIKLRNEFGSIKLDMLKSLYKYINKYNSVYSLYITILNNNNKKCNNAVELVFEAFENKNIQSYINLFSDQETWIINAENKIMKEYMPRRNYLGKMLSRRVESILYFVVIIYILYRGVLYDISQERNILLISGYKIKSTDVFSAVIVVAIIQFIFNSIKQIFVPTFTIKGKRKSSFLYRFSQKMKEPYNLIGLIISGISLVLAIMSIIK